MIANPLLRKAVKFEYAMLRTPLAALDGQLGNRLSHDSRVRTTVHKGLQVLDDVMSGVLAQPHEARPDDRPTEAGASTIAPVPREEARRQVEQMDEERAHVAEVIREEQPLVGELADPDLDVADVQAELRAKHLLEEQEEQRRRASG